MGLLNFNSNITSIPALTYANFFFGNTAEPYNTNSLLFSFSNNNPVKYNENLKLINGKPEIAGEENLSDEKLIQLKQSPARQKLSVILRQCDSEEFSYQRSDAPKMKLLYDSGIMEKTDLSATIDKILISKTNKILKIINGIKELNTGSMSETEMEAKVKEYNEILEKARSDMQNWRRLMDEGAQLASRIIENKKNEQTITGNETRELVKKFETLEQSAEGIQQDKEVS